MLSMDVDRRSYGRRWMGESTDSCMAKLAFMIVLNQTLGSEFDVVSS